MTDAYELDPYNPDEEELDMDPTWFTREFEELDEKLPIIAKDIVLSGIAFQELEKEEPCDEVLKGVLGIMDKHLECLLEMTEDELQNAVHVTVTSCHLVCMCNEGYVHEDSDGKYSITQKGIEIESLLNEGKDT